MTARSVHDHYYVADDDPHYVYSFFGADGSALYTGCTGRLAHRLAQHRSSKNWWPQVARIEIDVYPDRLSGLDAERERIARQQPAYNTVFTDRAGDAVRGAAGGVVNAGQVLSFVVAAQNSVRADEVGIARDADLSGAAVTPLTAVPDSAQTPALASAASQPSTAATVRTGRSKGGPSQ